MAANGESTASAPLLPPAPRRITGVFVLIGVGLGVTTVGLIIGLILATIRGDYFSNTKEVRDAATSGSDVLAQLGQFGAVGAWLTPFIFLGVAAFFLAIIVALSAIVKTIPGRGGALSALAAESRTRS